MPSTSYINRLREEKGPKFDARVERARRFYANYGSYVLKYRGGMDPGFLAAIAEWESGGKMGSSGDAKLGEVGFFQIENSTPGKFSARDVRHSPEGNIFLACLEYNATANRLAQEFPALIWNGSVDQWKMARLAFAIGYGGTRSCIEAAKPRPGACYAGIQDWADRTGAKSLGAQSASKVWFRIHAVDVQWSIGMNVAPFAGVGVPSKIPSPSGVSYQIPERIYGTLAPRGRDLLLAIGGWLTVAYAISR